MSNIATLTFNPCVDKSTSVEKFIPEKKLWCSEPKFEPGGGGINVSRAIKKLGGNAVAIYPAGGYIGTFFNELLQKENITISVIETHHALRENMIILETSSNNQFRFGMPGAPLLKEEVDAILQHITDLPKVDYFVASGSIPEGVPADIYARIAKILKEKNCKFIVDTSGEPLKHAAEQGVYLLKPNLGELAFLTGEKEIKPENAIDYGKQLIAKNCCEILVISMGADGAALVTKNEALTVKAPVVERKSTVGAGDSMVAGMVYSLSKGMSIKDSFLYGLASGSAATMNTGTELCHKEDADRLFEELKKNQGSIV